MSFGFSVGDFFSATQLIFQITQVLSDAGGSRSDYQELLRELHSLDKALKHVDRLQGPTAEGIKCAALMCRHPLEDFLNKIRVYDKSLGIDNNESNLKSIGRKIQWGFVKKDEVNRLRDYLNLHMGSINMQLLTAGLETLHAEAHGSQDRQLEIRSELEKSRTAISSLGSRINNFLEIAKRTKDAVGDIFTMVRVDVVAPLKDLVQAITRLGASTQEIYLAILEIRTNVTGVDTRFTYLQAPAKIEDALGRVWMFPSEFSVSDLHAIIRNRFIGEPGQGDVEAGNYELFDSYHPTAAHFTMRPGVSITMAVIVRCEKSATYCPSASCRSSNVTVTPNGRRNCQLCGMWFEPTEKKRKRIEGEMIGDIGSIFDIEDDGAEIDDYPTKRRKMNGSGDTFLPPFRRSTNCTSRFKNVRVPQKPHSSSLYLWEDDSGKFSVEAEFLSLTRRKGRLSLILHKANGVRIAVPATRMSVGDLDYVSSALELPSDVLPKPRHPDVRYYPREPQEPREWVDVTGSFTVRATLLRVLEGLKILMRREKDDKKIVVPMRRLCADDRAYVRQVCDLNDDEDAICDFVTYDDYHEMTSNIRIEELPSP